MSLFGCADVALEFRYDFLSGAVPLLTWRVDLVWVAPVTPLVTWPNTTPGMLPADVKVVAGTVFARIDYFGAHDSFP